MSRIDQGAGEVPVGSGAQVGGKLQEMADVGHLTFNLPLVAPYWNFLPRDRAFGSVFSNADGAQYSVLAQAPSPNPLRLGAPIGAVSHLDEYQAYVKRSSDASLRVTVAGVLFQAVDATAGPGATRCVLQAVCPLRMVVRFHARAYAASAGGDFYDTGGVAYLEGRHQAWSPGAATSADSPSPLWGPGQFALDGDADDSKTGASAEMHLTKPRTIEVPLGAVHRGELFAVHVSLEAQAVNELGSESGAQVAIQDPQHFREGLLATRGLTPLGKPTFKEPAIRLPSAARCPAGTPRNAGSIQLSAPSFTASESSSDPLVLVTRTGGARGSASVTVSTHGGSAQSGSDFRATKTTIRFGAGDTSPRLVEIPIREDQIVESPESFTVSVGHPHCAKLGKQRDATVTILDDDQPPATPSPTFTVGGVVDGLAGSGLVLVDQGAQLNVTGNGAFTFPGTFPNGSPYDVRIQAQPTNPDQVCSVVDGTGTVTADVDNVAIHCTNVVTPGGLDSQFGVGGRVSTPGGGDARAVLVRPDGRIVVVGTRDIGVNAHTQFGAAGYDATGNLDPGFGTGGIATTTLGGSGDQAFDAADDRDGGFVAVGRTDAAGLTNTDFGVARYTGDGQPSPAFPAGGFVRTDVAGRGDGAKAVAVQPDGKFVAAGFAQTSPINFDFALVRYNPDGTLDQTFGGDGIVTTDIGDNNDGANGVAIQPDGKIVAVGVSGENIALARYLPDGALDLTFGGTGTVVSDLGFDDVANGVAITSGGTILVAGTRLGLHTNLDPFVASYGPNGKLNLGFGSFGVADTDLSGGDDSGDDIVLDPNGGIVVVGTARSSTVTDLAVVRYKLDGTFDSSLTTDFHGAGDFGHAVAVDPLGGIVAAGTIANGSENEFGLIRVFF
ncbi:MAG TPA: Calx-beta domain-containing protein [Solirubrobacteraceae bacterium]|nr:Calx-beta domain-containing protein [Solirubrobacteraceae bacterium]